MTLPELCKEVLELDEKATHSWYASIIGDYSVVTGYCGADEHSEIEIARSFKMISSEINSDEKLIAHYRTSAPKLAKACQVMEEFIRGKLVCLGKRHDCPSCNGVDAEEILAEVEKIVGEG